MLTRRRFLSTGSLAVLGSATTSSHAKLPALLLRLPSAFQALENSCGGRLGVAVLDTRFHTPVSYRQNERFAMCSTFKALLTAAILKRVDEGSESLDRTIDVPKAGLIAHSPITGQHAGQPMSVRDFCEAAMTQSDNTAANLLLARLGGPASVTAFARSIGDTITRFDRVEPELNETHPGELHDTTTPASMLSDLYALLIGNALSSKSRQQLTAWMLANTTGDDRLRSGIPKSWRVADKTGSDGKATSNDIAEFWPPNRQPILVTAYLTECPGPESHRSAALAQVAKLIAEAIG